MNTEYDIRVTTDYDVKLDDQLLYISNTKYDTHVIDDEYKDYFINRKA